MERKGTMHCGDVPFLSLRPCPSFIARRPAHCAVPRALPWIRLGSWLPKNPLRFPFITVATLVVSPTHSTAEVRQEFNIPYVKVRGIHAILVMWRCPCLTLAAYNLCGRDSRQRTEYASRTTRVVMIIQ